jgi:hypothetical protein
MAALTKAGKKNHNLLLGLVCAPSREVNEIRFLVPSNTKQQQDSDGGTRTAQVAANEINLCGSSDVVMVWEWRQ